VANLNKKAYEGVSKLGKSIQKNMVEPKDDFECLNWQFDNSKMSQTIMDYLIRHNLKKSAEKFQENGIELKIEDMKTLEKMLGICDLISNGDSFEAEKWVFDNFEQL